MKTQSSYSLGRAALSYALILLSADVVAKTSKSTGRCTPQQIGNGHCDKSQNNEACGRCWGLNGRKRCYELSFWVVCLSLQGDSTVFPWLEKQ